MSSGRTQSRRLLPRLAIRGLTGSVARLPPTGQRRVATVLGTSLAGLPLARRRIALENLALALPDLDRRAHRRILRSSLRHWVLTAIELVSCVDHRLPTRELCRRVRIVGLEHLDAALRQGHGAIALSAHMGNFPWGLLALAAHGYPVAAIYKEASDLAPGFFGRIMRDYGVTPMRVSGGHRHGLAQQALKALRAGTIVFMQIDQATASGIPIDFFGHAARTPTGPVVLARRSGAPIVPMFMYHEKTGHRLEILPVQPLATAAGTDQSICRDLRCLSFIVEDAVRRRPEEWYWVHRRWKPGHRGQPSPCSGP